MRSAAVVALGRDGTLRVTEKEAASMAAERLAALPRAILRLRAIGELAVELHGGGPARRDVQLGDGRDERRVAMRRPGKPSFNKANKKR